MAERGNGEGFILDRPRGMLKNSALLAESHNIQIRAPRRWIYRLGARNVKRDGRAEGHHPNALSRLFPKPEVTDAQG